DAMAERTIAIEDEQLRSYDGGWAEYVRRREERRAPDPQPVERKRPRVDKPTAPKHRPSELQLLEAQISSSEERVAGLERRLADDWSDVETLTEHRRARDELESLLARWETLFERSQA